MSEFHPLSTPEQDEGIRKISTSSAFMLADKTGFGKSMQALLAFRELKKIHKNDPRPWAMIVVTTKTAAGVWPKETLKWLGYSAVTIEKDDPEFRVNDSDIFVVSFDSVKKSTTAINATFSEYNVILCLDEVHELANPKSKLMWFISKIRRCAKSCWGLTATPLLNKIEKMYYIFHLVYPGLLGNYEWFENQYIITKPRKVRIKIKSARAQRYYENRIDDEGYARQEIKEIVGYKNLDDMRARIAPYMLRRFRKLRAEIEFRKVELSDFLEPVYQDASQGLMTSDPDIFGARMPSLQLAVDNTYGEGDQLSSKEQEMLNILQEIHERGEGAIVFTFFNDTFARIKKVIKDNAEYKNLYLINGSTSGKRRDAIEDKLSKGDILLSTAVGTASRNFQAVNNTIFYNIPFQVITLVQGLGRTDRKGSTYENIHAYILVTLNTVDEYKTQYIANNLAMIKQVIGGPVEFPDDYEEKSKSYIYKMRRKMLWRK
ncbi:hypothetical protein DRO66_02530 [Candidatus Bathyarchaeota archaeon]|nr:MAG: hypothetical protein DRO66_02530 [Candidatus Bathyarchaeota archaeon]